jgi:hypothetical protein
VVAPGLCVERVVTGYNMRRFLAGLAILGAAGVVAVVAVISLAGRDIPEPDVGDLQVARLELPAQENAYAHFLSATDALCWPTNATLVADYLEGKPVEADALAEVLDGNGEAMELIHRGNQCQHCIAPEVNGFDDVLPHLSPWRNLGRVLAAQTRQCRLAGRHAEATESCITLLRFADLIQKDAEGLIHYLVGISILNLGLEQAQDLARETDLPPDVMNLLSSELAELGPLAPGLVRALKVEYRAVANTTDHLSDGEFDLYELSNLGGGEPDPRLKGKRIPRYTFQPNKTKLTFANLYRNMIADVPLAYADMKRADVEEALGLNQSRAGMLLRPNGVGRVLYGLLVPATDRLLEHKCRAECALSATRLMVACQQYRHREGVFPDRLEALVPDFLPALPVDPFDGRAFRYDPSRGIIYSVGLDLRDSGGSTALPPGVHEDTPSKQRWKAEDVVFGITPAPARGR